MKKRKIKKQKNTKLKYIFLILFIFLLILAIRIGIAISQWQNLALDMIPNQNSIVLDTEGNNIAELGNERNRETISATDMPEYLKNAYIAIEDQRFYHHFGIDIKRTSAAIVNYVIRHNASFGGSTITQQLVKNLTNDNSAKISRKVTEWFRAMALESVLSKEEILEAYLNIIYIGPNMYGVETGAKYYFNKSASELSIAESAFLAGINIAPNSYDPFDEETDHSEKIHQRVKTVLEKMKELGYLSEEEYRTANQEVDNGIHFKKGTIKNTADTVFSYHTDALITELISDLAKKKHISQEFATNYLYSAGLKIYSTQEPSIQKTLEEEFTKNKYQIKSSKDAKVTSQAAMVIIDQSTGYVVGCVGGLGEKKSSRGFNRATQAIRQTGSSSKPIAVLAPALSKKIITPSSVLVDEATTFDDGTDEGYTPTDYNDYQGAITVRQAVESSQNIPFVKIMEQLTPKTAIHYMKKMGISTLTDDDNNLNLALGGLDKGISPLEMASAYATIANHGVYIEPTFYSKVVNSSDKTILKTKQTTRRVFSSAVSYIVTQLLTQPVIGPSGTATYCAIPHIDVAAKTGTTNENYDRWLCGFTPYYTAVTWYGFDFSETINYHHKNPAGLLWDAVMTTIHTNLSEANFTMPNIGIETATVCPISGMLASDACSDTYTEYFLKGTLPDICTECTSQSTSHKKKINKPATPNENGESSSHLQENSNDEPNYTEPDTTNITENTITESPSSTPTSDDTKNVSNNDNNDNTNVTNATQNTDILPNSSNESSSTNTSINNSETNSVQPDEAPSEESKESASPET